MVYSLFGMGGDFLSDHWLAVKEKDAHLMTPGADRVTQDMLTHLLAPALTPTAEAPIVLRSDGTASDVDNRWFLFTEAWRNGNLLDFVLGVPVSATLRELPYAERLTAIPPRLRPAFLEDQINATFPPTYFLHGALDHVVSQGESEKTYRRLRELGVNTVLDIVPDADHGLITRTIPPLPAPGADEAQERGMDFVEGLLRQ